jgi:cytoskeletal protein CcmA (bactofilin family)
MLSNFTSKKSDKDAEPVKANAMPPAAPPQTPMPPRANIGRAGERAAPSIIGPDLTIMGNLISAGEVQVDGEVQGDLHGTHVVIGEKARITGGIMAQEIVVRGHVMGSIRGNKVMLQASSHVEGDVHHQSLAIEQGAYFEGKSRRSSDPLADVVRPQIAQPSSTAAND